MSSPWSPLGTRIFGLPGAGGPPLTRWGSGLVQPEILTPGTIMIHSTRYLILVALVVPACGANPVSYSAPVGINLSAKSGDVASNVVSQMQEITTETSNPYGAFINN